jgi:hypothetical protein
LCGWAWVLGGGREREEGREEGDMRGEEGAKGCEKRDIGKGEGRVRKGGDIKEGRREREEWRRER